MGDYFSDTKIFSLFLLIGKALHEKLILWKNNQVSAFQNYVFLRNNETFAALIFIEGIELSPNVIR